VSPDGGATAATASVAISGTATGTGTITVSAVDERQFTVNVGVAVGDTNTEIAEAIDAAFDALETRPPFVATNATGTLTLTATDVGTAGNYYGIKVSGSVAGITYTVTGWTGGATDPTVTSIFDPIDGLRYTGVNWPEHWGDSLTTVIDLLDERFNVSNDIQDGMAFHGRADTYANLLSYVSTLNSQSLVVMGNNKIDEADQKGPAILRPASWDAAYFQGVRARRLTPSAPISDYIVAQGGPLDSLGGPSTASLPYFNTPLDRTPVTMPTYLFSNQDQVDLEDDGVSTYGVNSSINGMITGPIVTTRTTDAAGNENDSFHYLNFVDTGSVCREIFFRNLKATFAQSRLTEGDTIEGYSMANDLTIKAELLRIYRVLAGVALVQAGDEAEQFFATNTNVSINLAQRSATIDSLLPIVTQLGTINYVLTLQFTVASTGTQTVF
jgi:phage tail sheath gpL-like